MKKRYIISSGAPHAIIQLETRKGSRPKLTDKVLVCSECLRASCAKGILCCEDYKRASLIWRTVSELQKLDLEHWTYWGRES